MAGRRSPIGDVLFVLTQIVGVAAFAYPFVSPQPPASEAIARASDAPLILGLTLLALFGLLATAHLNAKMIAVLGVLCAINAALRLAETLLLPLPGGFSPVFLLIILMGYAYGARFGFLFGAFSLLASALATGGVGPWLPFQMYGAGWVGLTAGLVAGRSGQRGRRGGTSTSRSRASSSRRDLMVLLPFGLAWGFLYGAILNLYFWPLIDAGAGLSFQSGAAEGFGRVLARYAAFYAATSLWWDLAAAIGNVVLLAWLGLPILNALRRFGSRFQFEAAPSFEPSGADALPG